MDTPFERIDSEMRRDWHNHPVTQAYLATLADCRRQLATYMLQRCEEVAMDKRLDDLRIAGGERKGIAFAIELAGSRADG